jgi:adenylate cyclase
VEFSKSVPGGLPTRFGADVGVVTLGAIGSPERVEYRAVGDAVNTSNRLQELNKKLGTRILVSESLIDGIEDCLVRELGWFVLRGKTRQIHVYELLGSRTGAPDKKLNLCDQFSRIAQALRASELVQARSLLRRLGMEHADDVPIRQLLDALDRPGAFREGAIYLD